MMPIRKENLKIKLGCEYDQLEKKHSFLKLSKKQQFLCIGKFLKFQNHLLVLVFTET